jgi:thioredoxin-related protein
MVETIMNKNIVLSCMIAFMSLTMIIVILVGTMKKSGPNGDTTNWNWSNDWGVTKGPILPPPTFVQPMATPQAKPDAAQKKTVLFFTASWCHWCDKMKQTTLNDAKVKAALANYSLQIVDIDQDRATAKKFGVRGVPAYVITDVQGAKIKSGDGYKPPDEFLSWLSN